MVIVPYVLDALVEDSAKMPAWTGRAGQDEAIMTRRNLASVFGAASNDTPFDLEASCDVLVVEQGPEEEEKVCLVTATAIATSKPATSEYSPPFDATTFGQRIKLTRSAEDRLSFCFFRMAHTILGHGGRIVEDALSGGKRKRKEEDGPRRSGRSRKKSRKLN